MSRFYIVARSNTMVADVAYAAGDTLKTFKGKPRSWEKEEAARRYLTNNIQSVGEKCGWIVTQSPEVYR